MPLLPEQAWWYPENLFEVQNEQPPEGVWWVLHTHPRTEKSVARSLAAHHIPFFLPVYENSRRVKGRVQTTYFPLFSGYLFLKSGDEGRTRALETNQIANCLPVSDQAQLWGDLQAVHRVMMSGSPLGPQAQLVQGAAIMIMHGPLAGLKGKFVRHGNKVSLVVEVEFLRQGVNVEIESWMVEPLSSDRSET